MPNIKNTNQVIVNNNIKAQDELKILSKLSKMGLLKTNKKRAPRQAPQMIPQAPEVGRTAPIAFDRTGSQEALSRAAIEEVARRSAVDLADDVRFTNQGSQDIPQDSRAAKIDVAPEAETIFPSEPAPLNVDIGIQSQPALVRNQEQEIPEQRPNIEDNFLQELQNVPVEKVTKKSKKEREKQRIKEQESFLAGLVLQQNPLGKRIEKIIEEATPNLLQAKLQDVLEKTSKFARVEGIIPTTELTKSRINIVPVVGGGNSNTNLFNKQPTFRQPDPYFGETARFDY